MAHIVRPLFFEWIKVWFCSACGAVGEPFIAAPCLSWGPAVTWGKIRLCLTSPVLFQLCSNNANYLPLLHIIFLSVSQSLLITEGNGPPSPLATTVPAMSPTAGVHCPQGFENRGFVDHSSWQWGEAGTRGASVREPWEKARVSISSPMKWGY